MWSSSNPSSAALSAVALDNGRRRGLFLAEFWRSRNAKLSVGPDPSAQSCYLDFTHANPPAGLQS